MKKYISMLIVAAMLVAMIPAAAFAESSTAVCSIGKIEYRSVEDAISAAKDGSVIKMQQNVSDIYVDAERKSLVIDLNGKTVGKLGEAGIIVGNVKALTLTSGQVISKREAGAIVVNKGVVTIKDVSVINGNTTKGPAIANIGGMVEIIEGSFTAAYDSTSAAVATGKNGKTILDACTYTNPADWSSAKSFTAIVDTTPDVTLDGTDYSSYTRAMAAVKNGSTMVVNHNLPWLSIDVGAVDFILDLNGKTIGNVSDSSCLYVNTEGTVRIINGSAVADEPDWGAIWIISGNVILENITAHSANTEAPAVKNSGGNLEIISGTFSTASGSAPAVETATEEGVTTVVNTCSATTPYAWEIANSFTVTEDPAPAVTVDGVKYSSQTRACAALKDGSVMIVNKDLPWLSIDVGAVDFTLDLNGKTIGNVSDSSCLYVDTEGSVRIINGSAVADEPDWGAIWIISGNVILENITAHSANTEAPAVKNSGGNLEIISGTFSTASGSAPAVETASGTTGIGTYTAPSCAQWEAANAFDAVDMKGKTITLEQSSYSYNGKAITPAVKKVTGVDPAYYNVSYKNNVNAGTATVIVSAKHNNNAVLTKTFKINPAKLTSASLSATSYVFNNKAKTPTVTVKAGSLKPATKISKDSKNIDLTYATGRKNVGKYKVTIKGKGNYTGTITKTFKINPKGVSIGKLTKGKKAFTVKWSKPTKIYRSQITGYQIRYSTSSKMTNTKTVKVKSTTATTKTIKKLKAKKTYYVQIRTYKVKNGVTYTSAWSAKKKVVTK